MLSPTSLPFGWSANKWSLILLNMFGGVILIKLSHTDVFPLSDVNFLFFSFLGLLFALYRPGWAFLLLIGMLPYEIISIAPESYGISLHPYQWLLLLVSSALSIRFFLKRFPFEKFVPTKWDIALALFGIGSVVSALGSVERALSLKLCLVLFSLLLLYFVTRIFIRTSADARMIMPFVLSSFFIIACYAILQNIFYLSGKESFEVMIGRPNATFPEADWLGGYLATLIVSICALIASPALLGKEISPRVIRSVLSALLFFGFIALILSVSRSAWLATFAGILAVSILYTWQGGIWRAFLDRNRVILFDVLQIKLHILLPLCLAVFTVSLFHLSPFDLIDRTTSTATGEQKITVACERAVLLPRAISRVEELQAYNCTYIPLEEIASRKAHGEYVTEVFRDDPNIHLRSDIYTSVLQIIRNHPILGIGFGTIASILGEDERGAGLNASNLFLEIWLGAGIMGIVAFSFFFVGQGSLWLYRGVFKYSPLALLLVSLFTTLTVFNLFNSGLMLGFFFVCLALFIIVPSDEHS